MPPVEILGIAHRTYRHVDLRPPVRAKGGSVAVIVTRQQRSWFSERCRAY